MKVEKVVWLDSHQEDLADIPKVVGFETKAGWLVLEKKEEELRTNLIAKSRQAVVVAIPIVARVGSLRNEVLLREVPTSWGIEHQKEVENSGCLAAVVVSKTFEQNKVDSPSFLAPFFFL